MANPRLVMRALRKRLREYPAAVPNAVGSAPKERERVHCEAMVRRDLAVPEAPTPALLKGVVSEEILRAVDEASDRLRELGIPHAIVGGLAVGAWGHPRATKDVDFLVRGNDAFAFHGSVVSFKPGVPIASRSGVAIDYLLAEDHQLDLPEGAERGVYIGIEGLFLLKLRAKRAQDDADLITLLKRGAPRERIREWLRARGLTAEPDRLASLATRADEEDRR